MKLPTSRPLAAFARFLLTMLVLALAIWAGWMLWMHYEVEPWTRDGRVKANVVQVAPDVSGLVMNVAVHDNQDVKAGELLFEIDRARYQLAYDQAQAVVRADIAAQDQALRDVKRNRSLGKLVAAETLEQSRMHLQQAQAALAQAKVQLASAELNLTRSRVYAVTDGRITNLSLRVGDYVTVGKPVLALIDSASFYVEGYFEEGKLGNIHLNDPAAVTLMGSSAIIRGHVQSIALGIADRDRSIGSDLLPNVNPVFNWIRLAQRVPVRIAIDKKDAQTTLVAGQTATVSIEQSDTDRP
ncbi:efflux RND transporter periplasmic adaptor subunit [Advenella mimigardefordensis]|uniref:Putative hemolysin D, HlyD family n=1 Tax=Advenella mimigardefordensis (strain DSM 17166 / LMG 22922 / DPN7) TaxID=1247726 RepID=W0PDZ3_ADVMD|nr:HlyD family secretion protein [Advenella mimigardefordensis]AHG65094.1 putative hemolysin D, HlyD family [Advenella mimigardefordensis DPN7]